MATVHCPDISNIRLMSDCLKCTFHVEDGTSLEWCKFRIKETAREEIPINALRLQMESKIRQAESLYIRGKTRIADNLSYEAAMLHREIKRRLSS